MDVDKTINADEHNCPTCLHGDTDASCEPCAECIPWILVAPYDEDDGTRNKWEPDPATNKEG